MADITTIVDSYFSPWNESDPERRRELITTTFTEDASYVGPMIAGHGAVRYAWEIVPAPGQPALAADVDFGIVGADGRFQSITTFLDLVPEGTGQR